MKAYLTFARRKEDDVHMLGIDNPTNICDILFANLRSGQPIIPVLLNNKIIALYIIDVEGNLYQIIGDIDLLFELDELNDLSLKNLQKYNLMVNFELICADNNKEYWAKKGFNEVPSIIIKNDS